MLNVATVQKHREPVQSGYMLQAAGHSARTGGRDGGRRDGRGFAMAGCHAFVWSPRHCVT